MTRVKIKQTRSTINSTKKQKSTLQALGLRRINQSVEHDMSSQLKGMIEKVKHLVIVEEV